MMSSVDVQRMIAIMDKNSSSNAAPTSTSRSTLSPSATVSQPSNTTQASALSTSAAPVTPVKSNAVNIATPSKSTPGSNSHTSASADLSSTKTPTRNNHYNLSPPRPLTATATTRTTTTGPVTSTDLKASHQQTKQENLDAVDAAIRDLIGSANITSPIPNPIRPASPDITMITSRTEKTDVTLPTSNKAADLANKNSSKEDVGTTSLTMSPPITTPAASPTASPPSTTITTSTGNVGTSNSTPLKQHPKDFSRSPNKRRQRPSPKYQNPFANYDTTDFSPVEPLLVPNTNGSDGNKSTNGVMKSSMPVTTTTNNSPPILQTFSNESASVATPTKSLPSITGNVSYHSYPSQTQSQSQVSIFTTANSSVSSKSTAISHHLSSASQPLPFSHENVYPNNAKGMSMGYPTSSTNSIGGGGSISSHTQSFYSRQVPTAFQQQQLLQHQQQQEQILFEQRLCNHEYGVGVRKIHSNGKSQLRFVKCIPLSSSSSKNRRMSKTSSRSSPGSLSSPLGRRAGARSSVANANASQASESLESSPKSRHSKGKSGLIGRIQTRRGVKHAKSTDTTSDSSTKLDDGFGTTASTSSPTKSMTEGSPTKTATNVTPKQEFKAAHALTWGNKKKVSIPLTKITAVHKGKTTERSKKNAAPASHILSLLTSDRKVGSLDIEAPTQMDRDKFVQAFCIFLGIPLVDDSKDNGGLESELISPSNATVSGGTVEPHGRTTMTGYGSMESVEGDTTISGSNTNPSKETISVEDADSTNSRSINASVSHSVSTNSRSKRSERSQLTPQDFTMKMNPNGQRFESGGIITGGSGALLPDMIASPSSEEDEDLFLPISNLLEKIEPNRSTTGSGDDNIYPAEKGVVSTENKKEETTESKKMKTERDKTDTEDEEEISVVSSLTQGFDQEIVEELHQALNELRSELDASRAEAARAVKVAEQAIQSAESCSSNDWNSTVTHKAAEAAAQAQKRSAEAIAKQRQAEEKLIAEKKSAAFWKKQAQRAEEKISSLQTKVASADVQRAAMVEELDTEKKKAAIYIQTLKRDYMMSENIQRDTLASTVEQNRLLEIELDMVRRDLEVKEEEAKTFQEIILEMKSSSGDIQKSSAKKKFFGSRSKKERGPALLDCQTSSTSTLDDNIRKASMQKSVEPTLHSEQILKLQAEATAMRKQFELLRRTTNDELMQLPEMAKEWANKSSKALKASQNEVITLKSRLSLEMSNRRKLLSEVQDLRGNVRVYCRPRPCSTVHNSIISAPSHEVGLVHREIVLAENNTKDICPMSFEFDRMFAPNTTQNEMYSEMEDLVQGVLQGYNSCIIAYGQTGSGKTHSIIGDFTVHKDEGFGESAAPEVSLGESGMHLIAAEQLFQVSAQRMENFKDSFSLTIVEIHDEKLVDMVVDTPIGDSRGRIVGSDGRSRRGSMNGSQGGEGSTITGKQCRLEIRTTNDGDTVVQGLISVPVKSYEEVVQVWKESLASRARRLQERGTKLSTYEASTHLIATLQVTSKNLSSGYSTIGKIHFVDMAGSDAIPRRSSHNYKSSRSSAMDELLAPVTVNPNSNSRQEWRFVHKSITHFADVADARAQFSRSVPYRNSTLTHVLRDSLEADTKVLVLLCVSPDAKDIQDTVNSMRFGTKIRKVVVGKATKHCLTRM